jgi:hypothetical protein
VHSYTAPGDCHGILEWPRFYELEVNGESTDPDELRPFFLQRVTPKPRHGSLPVVDDPAQPDAHRAPEKGEEI